ncbi:uncharacterized protein DNG_10451 [Cephalotrichum gorgonifer]|uniref:LysM domain-containing protein n=1 Tax=Cephalotrichum gorgonifer TaxID=2041049 RepID=A0AAE8T0B0_9PEZI|nr:uncharacterized protein DNG_10451 [Cephalotrichum gorgonifer]
MMVRPSLLASIGLLAGQSFAADLKRFDDTEPWYDHDDMTPADCSLWWNSDDGLSCDTVLIIAGISISQLTSMNPSIKSCADWKADYSFCIASDSSIPDPTPAPDPTPTPDPPGMVYNCNAFYKVQNEDTCTTISSKTSVSIANLAKWNTEIGGTACTGIWAEYYICIGIIGSSPTEPEKPNPTPQPIQEGMVENCNSWHLVMVGDTCTTIATAAKVTIADLIKWNTGIGSACTGMWAGYYLCTGVEGGPPTEPEKPNPTPQPIQDGMVNNCRKFHFVETGETCDTISKKYSITVANFTKWNPAAGSACTGLWAKTYACVGL